MCNNKNICVNGGLCLQDICVCLAGTGGPYCETIYECESKPCGKEEKFNFFGDPKHMVSCVYDRKTEKALCRCSRHGYSFDPVEKVCKICDCGEMESKCDIENGTQVCTCKKGSYSLGDRCEACECGRWATGCNFNGVKKTCVCDEGYVEKDGVCGICDCGVNSIRCRYDDELKKLCTCKPGFKDGNYGECKPMCNDRKRCANGGLCLQDICVCLAGTGGPYCERIYECENELCGNEVNIGKDPKRRVKCSYDWRTHKAYCACTNFVGFFDPVEKVCRDCKCGPHGTCRFKTLADGEHMEVCSCDAGFEEYKGTCLKCDCNPNGKCSFSPYADIRTCMCDPGFQEFSGKCKLCDCGPDSRRCSFKENTTSLLKVCDCLQGFKEEKGYCRDIDECLDSEKCLDPGSECENTIGSFKCRCQPGYVPSRVKNDTSLCQKIEEKKSDDNSWKIGCAVTSAVFIAIFIGLVSVILKIRK